MQLRLITSTKEDVLLENEDNGNQNPTRPSKLTNIRKKFIDLGYLVIGFLQGALMGVQIFGGIYNTGELIRNFTYPQLSLYCVLFGANCMWLIAGFFLLFGIIWNDWKYYVAHFNFTYLSVILVITNGDFFKAFRNVSGQTTAIWIIILCLIELANFKLYKKTFTQTEIRYKLVQV